jgi:hypothetical protein
MADVAESVETRLGCVHSVSEIKRGDAMNMGSVAANRKIAGTTRVVSQSG